MLKRELNVAYATALVLSKKLMEACEKGYNVGFLSGDIEVDAVHASGRRANEKRNRPQGGKKVEDGDEAPDPTALTSTGKNKKRLKAKGKGKGKPAVRDPEYGSKYPDSRRLVIPVRARSGAYCRGARKTLVAVALSETPKVVESVLTRFVAIPESILNTDGSNAYSAIGGRFKGHEVVDHNKEFSGPRGQNNNQAESWNWAMKRAERGMHTHLEPKYLLSYACAAAFRADHCKRPNGETLRSLLGLCMRVGLSKFIGYTHGRHPEREELTPFPRYSEFHYPDKGVRSQSNANGPRPR